jgi:2-oxo-4-hydroxy-4-carboxy--5-ureidoimidazoline (OHCU) decarboxylase
MITYVEHTATANTTARIFELKEEKDISGMHPCFLVDFLDAEGEEMLDVAWEYPTLREAKEHITEVLEGLAVG